MIEPKYTNELINESSPYLLQHANNPVNWHAWNEDILNIAKRENKLIIVSIGYSACHWCHVMEHESFEDEQVAEFMNKYFVSIKVDREEHPDIDNLYMNACHLTSGNGGWPLNAIALPDGRPVFAGTYFPKTRWLQLLAHFVKIVHETPEKLNLQAKQIEDGLKMLDNVYPQSSVKEVFNLETLDSIWRHWLPKIDFTWGGREGAPKFMMPNNLIFLIKYYVISKEERVLEAIQISLEKMALGGIFDQIGGGFSRYSTDIFWKVPHFEKMLYDNAQLLSVYANAYQLNKNPLYLDTLSDTIQFLEIEMKDIEGGYYAALDADSEGIEGKFYIWQYEEFMYLIDNDQAVAKYYQIEKNGNWENEENILIRAFSDEQFCKNNKIDLYEWKSKIKNINEKLYLHRSKRIKPGLDDKILLNWNSLLVNGFIDVFKATNDSNYLEKAENLIQFLLNKFLQNDSSLKRTYKAGKSAIDGLLIDYVTFADALFHLYQVTLNPIYLNYSEKLIQFTIQHFKDERSGLYFFGLENKTAIDSRGMETSDNVIPASNSIFANLLFKFGTLTHQTELIENAIQMLSHFKNDAIKNGSFFSNWACLIADIVSAPFEICIVGKDALAFLHDLQKQNLQPSIYGGSIVNSEISFLKDKKVNEGETLIFICKQKICFAPSSTVEEAMRTILAQS